MTDTYINEEIELLEGAFGRCSNDVDYVNENNGLNIATIIQVAMTAVQDFTEECGTEEFTHEQRKHVSQVIDRMIKKFDSFKSKNVLEPEKHALYDKEGQECLNIFTRACNILAENIGLVHSNNVQKLINNNLGRER